MLEEFFFSETKDGQSSATVISLVILFPTFPQQLEVIPHSEV